VHAVAIQRDEYADLDGSISGGQSDARTWFLRSERGGGKQRHDGSGAHDGLRSWKAL
jgi:hypothetical protein